MGTISAKPMTAKEVMDSYFLENAGEVVGDCGDVGSGGSGGGGGGGAGIADGVYSGGVEGVGEWGGGAGGADSAVVFEGVRAGRISKPGRRASFSRTAQENEANEEEGDAEGEADHARLESGQQYRQGRGRQRDIG